MIRVQKIIRLCGNRDDGWCATILISVSERPISRDALILRGQYAQYSRDAACLSRAGAEPFYSDAESVRLTVTDQKRNEHTGSPPPRRSSLRDSTIWLCLYFMREYKREREKEQERG